MAEWTAGKGTTALGIIGTSLGGLAVAGGNLLNSMGVRTATQEGCSENHLINRYEASQAARIAELETEVKLRDANTYTDSKILQVYQYFDGKLDAINRRLCDQDVWNATQTATIGCMAQQIAALNGMTKLVIPKANVCPEPMDRYNSWTAPTAAAANAG